MKTLIAIGIALALAGCAEKKTIAGKVYPPYGIVNEAEMKSDHVCYHASVGSMVVAVILVETIFVPVYTVGWDIWEADRLKTSPDDKCNIDGA